MNIHLSSSTIQSYENKNKTMDLFYSPIVIFENLTFEQVSRLEDVKFKMDSDAIGTVYFDVQDIRENRVQSKENRVFIEFKLTKKDVPFHKEYYDCNITFSATLESNLLSYSTVGLVKTKWSKGLI